MARALYVLGLVEREDRNWDAAEDALRRALDVKPQNLRYQLELARTLRLAGKKAEAAEVYENILEAHPDNQEAQQGKRATQAGN